MIKYTIEQLLLITNPCILFDKDKIKEEYRYLSFNFHPDKNSDTRATNTFAHITMLYNQALDFLKNNTWEVPGILDFVDINNKQYRIRYKKKQTFELGTRYVSDTIVAFFVDKKYDKLVKNFYTSVSNIKYSSDNMKKEFSRYMPSLVPLIETKDNYVIIINKSPDLILLSDVLEYYKTNSFPVDWDKHVAWIHSRLLNILCFLKFNGIVHHGISTDTIWISPEHHSISVLGGWFYTTKENDKMISIPKKLFSFVPPSILNKKISNSITDGELVKALSREISIKLPKPFENWLKFSASKNPMEEYKLWQDKILKESYGERKFINLTLSANDVYSI